LPLPHLHSPHRAFRFLTYFPILTFPFLPFPCLVLPLLFLDLSISLT
jgi:hypothetical protein